MAHIAWFAEISKDDTALVGGKGANLGEMYRARFPIPPGFVVTTEAFKLFLAENNLLPEIVKILSGLDITDNTKLQNAASKVQKMVIDAKMPGILRDEIVEAYGHINVDYNLYKEVAKDALNVIRAGREAPYVAVRSSATAEDLEGASFAGQQATFVNVKGNDLVLDAVQKCWASLYTARAIYYRVKNNFPHEKVFIAVVVQRMINSDRSGVVFTANPSTSNRSEIVIEAGFGLGDAVVAGEITPDHYVVSKPDFILTVAKPVVQTWMYTRDEMMGKTYKKELTSERGGRQKLSNDEIIQLAKVSASIEQHYGMPMDIEYAFEGGRLFIVQARAITTLDKSNESSSVASVSAAKFLEGIAASPGIVTGSVRILSGPEELDKVQKGDVLVARMTSPDYVPAIERACAIVTDEGGQTSHAAIVSREMRIPCVVGTEVATSKLKDGQLITVDGSSGVVYLGRVGTTSASTPVSSSVPHEHESIVTATKVYMNLGEPDKISEYIDLPFEGIGLMRLEFLITSVVRAHPLALLEQKKGPDFVSALVAGISKVARAIFPRPLIVRFSDFKTNEYRNLPGGAAYEPHEENPMIGWRGVSRYISDKYAPAFALECQAIKAVRDAGLTNAHVMLPFVRTTNEVLRCLDMLKEEGLVQSRDFHIWIMAEVPAVALCAESFARLPIAGCSIGSNDLTQGVLCVDRDSVRLTKMGYFDERNEAVLRAMHLIISGFKKHHKTVSICGQAPSEYPELLEFLVKEGITSVSVNPDVVISVRETIASVERRLLLSSVLQ